MDDGAIIMLVVTKTIRRRTTMVTTMLLRTVTTTVVMTMMMATMTMVVITMATIMTMTSWMGVVGYSKVSCCWSGVFSSPGRSDHDGEYIGSGGVDIGRTECPVVLRVATACPRACCPLE